MRCSGTATRFFALVGLYLHVEQHFSGRRVQHAHMKLASRKRQWPPVVLPADRGAITVDDVLPNLVQTATRRFGSGAGPRGQRIRRIER
jgi:hypothetical protein